MSTLKIVKGIEEAYEKAEEETNGFTHCYWQDSLVSLNRALDELPDRFWIE